MKRILVPALFAAGCCAFLLPASGAGAPASDCSSAANQMEMDACAGAANTAANASLNALYEQLMTMLNPQEQQLLTTAERQWISYRDAECAFETAETAGGSLHSTMVTQCLTDKTNARIVDLKKQIACPAGNLACPAN